MFENFLKGKQSSVVEQVERFNTLFQERAGVRDKEATLTRGLEQVEARLATIPGEVQAVHDNCYRNQVQREVDSTRPDLTESHNKMLSDLKVESADLAGKVKAYGAELQILQRTLGRLAGEHGEVERARRAAWSAIADQLISRVPTDFQKQFLDIWVSLDRVRDGIRAEVVLSKIASTELPTEIKVQTIEELSREFGVTNE